MKIEQKSSKESYFGLYSIRFMTNKDGNLMQSIYSDLKTRAFGFGREVTLEHAVKFFTPEDVNLNHFLFFKDEDFIGRAVLKPISDGTAASFGIAINPKLQGHGHGYQIGQFILNKAFNNPKIEKLSGTALKFNIPSQKLMQKLGMNPDGIQQKKESFQDYDTYSLAFSIDRDSYLKGDKQTGHNHPDSINFEDLIFEDYHSVHTLDKISFLNSIEFKRRELFIKLELEDPQKKLALYAGTTALSAAEMIESSSLLRYFFEEIFNPLLPYNNSILTNIFTLLPKDNTFWVTAHFSLTTLAYFSLSHYNPTFSFEKKLLIPISSSIGYASKLYIHNNQKILAEERIFNKLSSQIDISKSDISFLDDCLSEVALSSATAFLFSLPAALSFTPTGLSYSIFSTLSSTATSAVSCAYTNKKIISPNEFSISAKVLPYVADASIAFYLVNKISIPSLYFLPEIASSIKHASFILGSIVSTDQIAKALVELTPNEIFEYLDSFFSFHNEVSVSTEL